MYKCQIISHRANIFGPDLSTENRPDIIDSTINKGFNVEIDVRFQDNNFYLGHDDLEYKVNLLWLIERRESLLFHCKDLESMHQLSNCAYKLKYFGHKKDAFTLINGGLLWVDDLSLRLNNKCIIPLITKKDIDKWVKNNNINDIAGICTDFPVYLKTLLNDRIK